MLLTEDLLPTIARTEADVDLFIKKFERIVLKTPYSSSGRGVLILRENILNRSNRQWIIGNIRKFGFIMMEPYLDKLLDVSVQFYLNGAICKAVGMAFSVTNSKGGYVGNHVKGINIDAEMTSFFESVEFKNIIRDLSIAIQNKGLGKYYRGYFGVDMMICRGIDYHYFLQPCVEINLRYNMGILACFMERLIGESSYGLFKIITANDETEALLEQSSQEILWKEHKIVEGVLPLTPWRGKKHIAILEVDRLKGNEFILNDIFDVNKDLIS